MGFIKKVINNVPKKYLYLRMKKTCYLNKQRRNFTYEINSKLI